MDQSLYDNDFAKDFTATNELALTFDGMMNPLSVALFEALLQYQAECNIVGNCIEFGVYRGRSAAVILRHLAQGERMTLVDVKDYPEFDKLRAVNPDFQFIQGKSESLTQNPELLEFIQGGVRFSHHDASHTYVNVSAEMAMMDSHIAPRGIMVLDDFGNPSYMQVVAACFQHLARPDSALEVFLYANNKAYLCRKQDFDFYARFVIGKLLYLVQSAGLDCYVTRTDKQPSYRAFSIFPKANAEDPDRYGLKIFGDQFYKL